VSAFEDESGYAACKAVVEIRCGRAPRCRNCGCGQCSLFGLASRSVVDSGPEQLPQREARRSFCWSASMPANRWRPSASWFSRGSWCGSPAAFRL